MTLAIQLEPHDSPRETIPCPAPDDGSTGCPRIDQLVAAHRLYFDLSLAVRALSWFLEELHEDTAAGEDPDDWRMWGSELALWGLAERAVDAVQVRTVQAPAPQKQTELFA